MSVLIENASDPLGRREQKHVVTITIGPIGNGHARFVTGDQATGSEQQKSGNGGQDREPVQPAIRIGSNAFIH